MDLLWKLFKGLGILGDAWIATCDTAVKAAEEVNLSMDTVAMANQLTQAKLQASLAEESGNFKGTMTESREALRAKYNKPVVLPQAEDKEEQAEG